MIAPSRTAVALRRVAAGAALVLSAVALLATGRADAAQIHGPTPKTSWSARVLAPVAARVRPDDDAKAVAVVQPIAPLTQGPTILLVLDHRTVDGREWTKLLLPKRPNGTAGWVHSDVLQFRENPMRILIDQSQRITYVFRRGRVVLKVRNAVGTSSTPTPNGTFAIAEKALAAPAGFLGPAILVTTGFSNVLNEYAGGNGRFAMHGTSLPQLIGTRASHGCIRHRNEAILRISRMVAPGTPVKIQP